MEISIESSEESLHILQREVYHGKIEKKSEGLCNGAGAVCGVDLCTGGSCEFYRISGELDVWSTDGDPECIHAGAGNARGKDLSEARVAGGWHGGDPVSGDHFSFGAGDLRGGVLAG
mgnify:CR=1 FL=1